MVLLAQMAAACSVNYVTPITPQSFPAAQPADTVTIFLTNHQLRKLTKFTVQSDSAIGINVDGYRLAYPLGDVLGVQKTFTAPGRTIALVAAIGAVVYVIAFAIGMHKCAQVHC